MCLLDDDSSDSDEEFQPSFNLTLRQSNSDQLPIEYSDDESDTCDDGPAETDYKRENSIEDIETLLMTALFLYTNSPCWIWPTHRLVLSAKFVMKLSAFVWIILVQQHILSGSAN